jgi:hypothetical protein
MSGGSARRKTCTYTDSQTQKYEENIHALNGIRTHDPNIQAAKTYALYCGASLIGIIFPFWVYSMLFV